MPSKFSLTKILILHKVAHDYQRKVEGKLKATQLIAKPYNTRVNQEQLTMARESAQLAETRRQEMQAAYETAYKESQKEAEAAAAREEL